MNKKQNGFTLVELAIALMIIGLLIGGVLKGQELINNARVTTTAKQINDINTAIMMFRSTYNDLPGDIRRPQRIPGCTSEACREGGDGNRRIDTPIEPLNFFRHMVSAGMLDGPEGGTLAEMQGYSNPLYHNDYDADVQEKIFPSTAMGAVIWVGSVRPSPVYGMNIRTSTQMAQQLDEKIDDGLPTERGTVYGGGCDTSYDDEDGVDRYNALEDNTCDLWVTFERMKMEGYTDPNIM